MEERGEIPAYYKAIETPAIYYTRQYSLTDLSGFMCW